MYLSQPFSRPVCRARPRSRCRSGESRLKSRIADGSSCAGRVDGLFAAEAATRRKQAPDNANRIVREAEGGDRGLDPVHPGFYGLSRVILERIPWRRSSSSTALTTRKPV